MRLLKGPDNIGCPNLLNDAFTRYWTIIAASSSLERRGRLHEVGQKPKSKFWKGDKNYLANLENLTVDLKGECSSENVRPEFGDNENCMLIM